MRRFSCLILLLSAVISGCGSSGDEKKAAPEYAATPRKALESWVTAVRARRAAAFDAVPGKSSVMPY